MKAGELRMDKISKLVIWKALFAEGMAWQCPQDEPWEVPCGEITGPMGISGNRNLCLLPESRPLYFVCRLPTETSTLTFIFVTTLVS